MKDADEVRLRLQTLLTGLGRTDADVILDGTIPPSIKPELRRIIGPAFDDAARLVNDNEAHLLNLFERVILVSAHRRAESPPPFILWAIDIAARSVESGKTLEKIAHGDFVRSLAEPSTPSGPSPF